MGIAKPIKPAPAPIIPVCRTCGYPGGQCRCSEENQRLEHPK